MDRGPAGRLFDRLASRYDRGNRIISLGRDRAWKRRAVAAACASSDGLHLDLGAGTGDLARAMPGRVLAIDMSVAMLHAGAWPLDAMPVVADARRLPVQDASLDACVSGFLLRNVPDVPEVLREVHRVLRPGARFVVLEIAYPRRAVPRALFALYFHHVMPRLAGLVTGRHAEYRYLSDSLRRFPPPRSIADMARDTGFRTLRLRRGAWTGMFLLILQKPAPDAGAPSATSEHDRPHQRGDGET